MRKKVLFLITKGNFGGAQRYVYDLATSLPQKEFEVVVACGDQDGSTLMERLERSWIRTIALEGSGREVEAKSDFRVWRQIVWILKEEKPDIAHLNSSKMGFLGSLAVLYLKFLNLFSFVRRASLPIPRTIFTAHGWAFNERMRSIGWKIVYWSLYYFVILSTDKTIAVSEKTKRDVGFLPFLGSKIKVIHNGIDKFETLPREEARRELKDNGKILILSIGELHQSKGYDSALNAIKTLPTDIRERIAYRVIGGGEEKENLEKMRNDLGVDGNVEFLGPIMDAKKFLSGADFFLLPSRNENLPYSILEAGMCGLPIIATNVGGIPEVITDMESGILIHKENSKELRQAIHYLLEHPKKQVEFGRNIKSRVSQNFSKKRMLEETISSYQ